MAALAVFLVRAWRGREWEEGEGVGVGGGRVKEEGVGGGREEGGG